MSKFETSPPVLNGTSIEFECVSSTNIGVDELDVREVELYKDGFQIFKKDDSGGGNITL